MILVLHRNERSPSIAGRKWWISRPPPVSSLSGEEVDQALIYACCVYFGYSLGRYAGTYGARRGVGDGHVLRRCMHLVPTIKNDTV